MVDINNRSEIFKSLEKLNETDSPIFGKLSPQHMVEHLYATVMLSNGKYPVKLSCSEEEASMMKNSLIYSDMDFPMDFKAPMMGDDPPELQLPDLKTAIEKLKIELEDFDRYFDENKSSQPVNPLSGPLNKDEWVIFHNKHFAHHFKQYNLL